MASNYTSNPAATQPPSPAPGPGVLPVISVAAGTDAPTIESITQQMKVEADFIGHIQSAVRLDVPVVAASVSGFTAPSYSSFGGAVTPSGSVKINTGTRFVIKIIAGGAVGTATFQTSTDGGNTFGVTQTTAASMTDATSGITLAFSGTLTTAGTATFRSAFTPQAQWSDQLGHARTVIDHNGYLINVGTVQVYESWLLPPGGSGSIWSQALSTGASQTGQNPNANYGARYVQVSPSTGTTSASVSVMSTPLLFMPNATFLSAVLQFEIGFNSAALGTSSNVSFVAGFDNGNDPVNADNQLAFLCKKYNSSNWEIRTGNGGSPAITPTTVAPSSNPNNIPVDRVKIEIQGSASPYGSYQMLTWVNESPLPVITSFLPTAAQRILFGCGNEGGAAPSGSPLAYIGQVRCAYNYMLSPPVL